ncbi:hypothetical protein FLAG1_08326 [Fusarium langsethiae]|uniref:Uncharacterized protein n=1 Tax=Fusarium langsethiae TaxID=179993 RepID=A0A0M9ES83_FUSLA|nr:hypothetical protein FLAG1_08326 [Fusarium langsethiae]GKU07232.1 unnamed protein product [Fusarium langsethiae]GKU22127.1 unnamed protein product [Fusarium langsethiae]
MSDRKESWRDLPLLKEVGSLCPRLSAPEKRKKPASNTKVKITEEADVPDPLMVPDTSSELLDPELYRWPCWSCRIKFFDKEEENATPKRYSPKNRLEGITDKAVRDFIIAAEERLEKIKNGELVEEKPAPLKYEDIDLSTATIMTTDEEFEEFMEIHPFGLKKENETWFNVSQPTPRFL